MRTVNTSNSPQFVLDPRNSAELQYKMKTDPQANLKQVAQQFESLMLQMMLKTMRDATPQEGLFDSDQTRFFTSILDQQLSQDLSKKGFLGFAKMIEAQMKNNLPTSMPEMPSVPMDALQSAMLQGQAQAANLAGPVSAGAPRIRSAESVGDLANKAMALYQNNMPAGSNGSNEFVDRVFPHAVDAAKSLGVPAHFLVAQSALESGWGKSEIRLPNGAPSYNLFGIKAGKGWIGPSVEVQTTEYVDGVAQQQKERFRVYNSYQESFQDYANLLRSNPRYANVLGQQDGAAFARSLQQAGYATDPKYADKLNQIINGNTLRLAMK